MKFYTSDLHFNHNNIIRLCKRPFNNVVDMNNFEPKTLQELIKGE